MFRASSSVAPGAARITVRALIGCLVVEALVAGLIVARPLYARSQSARSAVCQDPWIDKMYNEINRTPFGSGLTGECNPLLYGGNWSSYEDLQGKFKTYQNRFATTGCVSNGDAYTQRAGCRDQAITDAVIAYKVPPSRPGSVSANLNRVRPFGSGEMGECNMYLWGAGRWNGTADLKDKVSKGFKAMGALGYSPGPLNQLVQNGRPVGQLFVGPPDAIAVTVKIGGVDTVRMVAADGYQPNSRLIPAARPDERARFTVHSLNNGSHIAVPR